MALEKVKVIGPEEVVDVMKQQIKEQYSLPVSSVMKKRNNYVFFGHKHL